MARKKKDIQFEWYVLNRNFNAQKTEPYNIFSNLYVNKRANEHCKDYYEGNITLEEFKENLRRAIQYEEWARTEYEILVGPWPPYDDYETQMKHTDKIDCYFQAMMNFEILYKYVLEKYKENM